MGPTVSKALAKPLKAAQEAMAAKNYDLAMTNIKAAQAEPGEKSAYDNYVINQMLLFIYVQKQDFTRRRRFWRRPRNPKYTTPISKRPGYARDGHLLPAEGLCQGNRIR